MVDEKEFEIEINKIRFVFYDKLTLNDVEDEIADLSSVTNRIYNYYIDDEASLDLIPPIILDENDGLVDGYHRVAVHEYLVFKFNRLDLIKIRAIRKNKKDE